MLREDVALCAADRRSAALAQALPAALRQGELRLVYQPQLCLTTGVVIGAEALLRWESPQFGHVAPAEFVPLAEASDFIVELGEWVLQQACAQSAAWRAAGLAAVRVGVNVSARQFRAVDVAALVRRVLASHRLPAQSLSLEVTEACLVQDPATVSAALRTLQSDGVEVALDDYGTGYSSVARLRDLALDVVKIDRSFVHDVTAASSAVSVTRSMIQLAHGLHLQVQAEGVETQQQLELLVAAGCDRVQGWVFSGAVEAAEFAQLLASGRRLPAQLTHRREQPRTLLLVDDEENILSALKRLFRRDGYRLLTAGSGPEGLELLAEHAVDVIVSDQRMPGMTGVDFLRRAKELRPETVRMTLSGYTDLQSIIDAVNEGAVYKFLTKPWDDERLREHVAQAFREHELAAENRRLTRELSMAATELTVANRRLEHLITREGERVAALQAAVSGARDLVDQLPLAVLGFDPDGLLAYANRSAFTDHPEWTMDLGGEPAPALRGLLEDAHAAAAAPGPADSRRLSVGGANFEVWAGALRSDRDPERPLGHVLMLHAVGEASPGDVAGHGKENNHD